MAANASKASGDGSIAENQEVESGTAHLKTKRARDDEEVEPAAKLQKVESAIIPGIEPTNVVPGLEPTNVVAKIVPAFSDRMVHYGQELNASAGNFGDRIVREITVPRSSVGFIIGRNGATVRRICLESEANVQFKKFENPASFRRTAILEGTAAQVEHAKRLIHDLVNRPTPGMMRSGIETFHLHTPAEKAGLVIGRRCETIKQIRLESGANVEFPNRDNALEKTFVISGTPVQVKHAVHLIRICLGDVAPGTPIPSTEYTMDGNRSSQEWQRGDRRDSTGFHSQQQMVVSPQQQQVQLQQQNFPAIQQNHVPQQLKVSPQEQVQQRHCVPAIQQGQVPQQLKVSPQQQIQAQQQSIPAIQQNQVPQQLKVSPQQQVQQQQQQRIPENQQENHVQEKSAGANVDVPIDPETGKPDYSAHWIAYYKSVGMLDQAEQVEKQMKEKQQRLGLLGNSTQ